MENDEKGIEASACKSIFRSGESTISKKQFTQAWIAMINRIEKGKRASIARQK